MGRDTTYGGELHPVVEVALEQVSEWMLRPRRIHNLRRERRQIHLTDPSARSAAISVFKELKYHGVSFPPHFVERWARAHGWEASDAQLLRDYAAGILAGATYHSHPNPFGPPGYSYRRWVAQVGTRSEDRQ